MLSLVTRFIRKHAMLPAGSRALVGVSGGADSVALLHILRALRDALGIELAAAHFNHMIRAEADDDERFVRELCGRLGVPIYAGRADVPALAAEKHVSVEVAARGARHAFFREVMAEHGYGRLALAHHMDDQAETVLLRLVRGAGGEGLGAMAPAGADGIVRPLLCVGREDIRRYCADNALSWREDASNADPSIPRNWVRLELLPAIRERLNPSAAAALCRAAELLRQDEEYLRAEAERALEGLETRPDGSVAVPADALAGLHPAVQSRALRLTLKRAGLGTDVERVNVGDVAGLLRQGRAGRRVDLDGGFAAMREAGALVVAPALPEDARYAPAALNVPGVTRAAGGVFVCEALAEAPGDVRSHAPNVQYFDMDAFPRAAVARGRLPGDRFRPLGAPGGRKLKEYLIDRKAPRWGRDRIPLLAAGNEVLWLVGHAIADSVKLTADTKRVLKITYEPMEDDV